jgi:membrane protein
MVRGDRAANAADQAAALAVNALVALIPMLLLLVSIGGLVLQVDRVLAAALHALLWAVPPADVEAAFDAVLHATRLSGWLGAVSVLGFAWVGANFVGCLARSLNRVYGVPERHFVHQRAHDFLLVLVFAVLFLLVSLAATLPTFFVGGELNAVVRTWALASGQVQALSYALAYLAAVALFLFVYRVVPNAGQRLGDVWPGTLVAAALLIALLQIFPVYLRLVGGVARYGQFFGFVPLVVAWFVLLAHVVLFGGYVNSTYQLRCRRRGILGGFHLPGCTGPRRPQPDGRPPVTSPG